MESKPSLPITKASQLFVEGKDDLNFFTEMVKHLSLENDLEIQSFDGVKRLGIKLSSFTNLRDFEKVTTIGIIRDADANADGAFQSVKASLERAKLKVPTTPEEISRDGEPAVGVMILPGQGRPGMLETLLCKTFADTLENDCIDAFFQCVEGLCPGQNTKNRDKARAYAFIATRSKPNVSVGVAAKEGLWDLDHDALAPLRQFLKSLVAETPEAPPEQG